MSGSDLYCELKRRGSELTIVLMTGHGTAESLKQILSEDFVSPASNPLFFEDPRTLTELRVHFANQWIPSSNPVFQGGSAQFLAARIRVALTQRHSIIATKDGYLWIDPANPAVPNSQGFADVAAGLKYNLVRNVESQTIVSVGGTF